MNSAAVADVIAGGLSNHILRTIPRERRQLNGLIELNYCYTGQERSSRRFTQKPGGSVAYTTFNNKAFGRRFPVDSKIKST